MFLGKGVVLDVKVLKKPSFKWFSPDYQLFILDPWLLFVELKTIVLKKHNVIYSKNLKMLQKRIKNSNATLWEDIWNPYTKEISDFQCKLIISSGGGGNWKKTRFPFVRGHEEKLMYEWEVTLLISRFVFLFSVNAIDAPHFVLNFPKYLGKWKPRCERLDVYILLV